MLRIVNESGFPSGVWKMPFDFLNPAAWSVEMALAGL